MKVLLLSIVAKCGVFTHVRDLANGLQDHGVVPVLGLINNQKTKRMFSVSAKDLTLLEKSLIGIDHFYYDTEENLMEAIKDHKFDIIHAHSPILFSAAMKISNTRDIPLVITLHSVSNWSNYYLPALNSSVGIIAVGPEVAKSVGVDFQSKIKIVYNGIDIKYFKPSGLDSLNKPLRIIWIGRTSGSAAKGAECLAKAVSILRKSNFKIEAKAIGLPLGADIRGLEYCGWVHDPLPYLQWSHMAFGRGRALREAMACGNAGFLIGEGYGGLVRPIWFKNRNQVQLSGAIKHGCSPLDSTQVAKDILYYYMKRNRLELIREEARQIAENYFDLDIMVKSIIEEYERVLKLK